MTDDEKLSYAYSYLRRKYVGPRLTSGDLVSEKSYLIERLASGDDFRNVGASENASGLLFTATGTTPAVWTKGSVLRLVDVAAMRALADTVFSDTTAPGVTITSGSFEGGQGSGVVTFERAIVGRAIERLLSEYDPDYSAPAPQAGGFLMQFGP